MPAQPDRRTFLSRAAASAAALAAGSVHAAPRGPNGPQELPLLLDDFDRADGLDLGPGWETLNPGGWRIEGGRLRRRLVNRGDRARNVDRPSWSFPYHWETHGKGPADAEGQPTPLPMRVDYDPSLPPFLLHRRDWRMQGPFALEADFTLRAVGEEAWALQPRGGEVEPESAWRMHTPGYGLAGLTLGAASQLESFGRGGRARIAGWCDDGRFGWFEHRRDGRALAGAQVLATPVFAAGTRLRVRVDVLAAEDPAQVLLLATLMAWTGSDQDPPAQFALDPVVAPRARVFPGTVGLAARGLLDFDVTRIALDPGQHEPLRAPRNELHVALPLGDTLARSMDPGSGVAGPWTVRFVCLFQGEGGTAEVRVSTVPDPAEGWGSVPAAGAAPIVTDDVRHHTALVDVRLPAPPHETTLYYTVWKDGVDVTADPRIGTDAVGPGTGLVPGVPTDGRYVGRLPQLVAPYRLMGLSCHAIHGNRAALEGAGGDGPYQIHDQPTAGAFQHLEDFETQVLLWEDDVWYLELVLFPPSTDDAYRIITLTMAGPTTRWQAMRHWNVLNPGDHDFGMDDVKGPEQLVLRNADESQRLGQDPEYLRRNFQIVQHLMQGLERPGARDNPRRWRRWQLPAGDFALLVCDGRLWRTSQDTAMWDDEGWGPAQAGTRSTYPRTDPTRTLLGEEQFAWLAETLRSEPAELVLVTGLNGLHTIWDGVQVDPESGERLAQRDRVAADYAGWVKAGADRVLELLAERPGVLSVYGDVHVGSIVENEDLGLVECSFGPIGRFGGRRPKRDFGPRMRDHDGRPVRVHALYHQNHAAPDLSPAAGPTYWNVLELELDPREGPHARLALRNLVDGPRDEPRGGGVLERALDDAPRDPSARLAAFETLPGAAVFLRTAAGRPLRAVRSDAAGGVRPQRLVGVRPGEAVLAQAFDGRATRAHALRAEAPA